MSQAQPPIVAEVVRSGFVESRHRGHLVALGPDGEPVLRLGDPDAAVFPRSTNKPLQSFAMLEAGLELSGESLAVACASHAGLPIHVDAVLRILAGAGLSADALDNTPDLPLDPAAARTLLASGGGPDRLHQNCSGNHAAMLATCVARGWPASGYLAPDHPLQAMIRASYARLAGTPMSEPAVDGCGAPLYAMSLLALAGAYRRVLDGAGASAGAGARVADAMRAHPEYVGGPGRPATRLMQAVPGLVAKGGAEAMFVAALPDGRVVAVKIDDGNSRACLPVIVAALRRLGVDGDELAELATVPVLGHGRPVGAVRAVF